jgi:hypothetical protein
MKKLGKVGKELAELSKEYHDEHPGMQPCFYCSYSGWENWLDKWNAEHTKSKARHPGLRFNTSIWVISCEWHNKDKGSKDIDEYLDILDERKKAHESGLSEI